MIQQVQDRVTGRSSWLASRYLESREWQRCHDVVPDVVRPALEAVSLAHLLHVARSAQQVRQTGNSPLAQLLGARRTVQGVNRGADSY